ncbi:MAG TPA: PQQ-dependent sugar dehydrogenase [Phycisphaerales bacterium]|nr:PQQ-dependent sugar dehydrogenase [Phycisphaerales bacterium]
MKIRIGLAAAVLAASAGSASADYTIATQVMVASGLSRPVFATSPVGDDTRLFIVEQRPLASPARGRIRIFNLTTNTLQSTATPFWVSPSVAADSEQGLLGLAFHPNYNQNGYFYVNYTRASDGATVIARGTRSAGNPDIANSGVTTVLVVSQPEVNHNGGWIAFGPEGYLYIAMGDGGGGNDNQPPSGGTTGNAQDLTNNLLGKILRIDVDGADNIPGNTDDDGFPADANRLYTIPGDNPHVANGNDDEIYIHGVRNPWRPSFDRLTGDLWVADVGQEQREEVTVLPFGSQAGVNLGWRCWEGTRFTSLGGCTANSPNTTPIIEYGHMVAFPPTPILGCSITGGYVYRGSAIPCFRGAYIFADYCSGDIFSLRRTPSGGYTELVDRRSQLAQTTDPLNNIMSFGEDNRGEVYILDQTGGELFKIVPGTTTGPDCNANSVPDDCDIRNGVSQDANSNQIPDECEVPTCDSIDFNGDGLFPDNQDLEDFFSVFGGGPCSTGTCGDIDFNNDGLFPDNEDLEDFLNVFGGGNC